MRRPQITVTQGRYATSTEGMVAHGRFGQSDCFGQQLEPPQGNAAVTALGSSLYVGEQGLVMHPAIPSTLGEAHREWCLFVAFGHKVRRAAVKAGYGGSLGCE
jgi:hypothetical protein